MVVAYDKNRGIGMGPKLPWDGDLPDDIKFFRDTTSGNAIIMGLKTYKAIGRPLPNRQNIVLTRGDEQYEGVTVVHTLDEAYAAVEPGLETYIIGGGQIFALSMESADRIFATEIDATFPRADVFFPVIDKTKWHETRRIHHPADERNKYDFDFVTYERVK